MRLSLVLMAAARKLPESYNNIPKRTIEKHTRFLSQRKPRHLPQYEEKIYRHKEEAYYDVWRPWEFQFQRLNQRGLKTPEIFVEPIRDWSYFRGDRVQVIKGPDKGKQGIINYIVKERNWVFVRGLNVRRTLKGAGEELGLGYLECTEEPYLVNMEVQLVDPSDLAPTEVEWQYDDDGNRVRVSKRTERIIPIPEQAYETMDYVSPESYADRPKDTPAKEVVKRTFVPRSKTFEMDICDEMGIKEERVPYPMYFY